MVKIGQFKQYLLQKEPHLIKICINQKSGQIMKKISTKLDTDTDTGDRFVYVKQYLIASPINGLSIYSKQQNENENENGNIEDSIDVNILHGLILSKLSKLILQVVFDALNNTSERRGRWKNGSFQLLTTNYYFAKTQCENQSHCAKFLIFTLWSTSLN